MSADKIHDSISHVGVFDIWEHKHGELSRSADHIGCSLRYNAACKLASHKSDTH